jgi:hypothetical protein
LKAVATSTLSASNIIKLFMHPRLRPCGISDWAILDSQLPIKFYKLFLFNVINLMLIPVLLAGWENTFVYLSPIWHHKLFFLFQLVHSEVWTSPVLSHSSYKYYVVFLDDYTHYLWTISLRNKSDVLPTIRSFISYVHTQFRLPILAFQTDNGREYDSTAMRLLSSLGTQLRLSCPYTSQQNGKAERILRTLNYCLRTMLNHSAAPLTF